MATPSTYQPTTTFEGFDTSRDLPTRRRPMKPKSEIDLRSAKNIISESLSVPTEIDVVAANCTSLAPVQKKKTNKNDQGGGGI